jgi:small-conductance mechanosensitive channel
MIQLPPRIRPDTGQIPGTGEFGQWRDFYLHGAVEKLAVFAAIALALYLLARFARQSVGREIEDVNRRHTVRKWIGYLYGFLVLLLGIALFSDTLRGFGTILALIIAGVAVALQDVLKSVVGWLYLSGRTGVQVGSRVEVRSVIGDVVDIGLFKTTLLEVGNLVYGRQSTGRLVTIPNYQMLSDAVFVSSSDNPFVWQEVRVVVPFESDWRRVDGILADIGETMHAEIQPELESGFRQMARRYAFKYGALTPIVYTALAENGVELVLRFMTHVRRRRGAVDRVTRLLLEAVEQEPAVHIAVPALRVYRPGAGAEEVPREPDFPEGT